MQASSCRLFLAMLFCSVRQYLHELAKGCADPGIPKERRFRRLSGASGWVTGEIRRVA
jgi:hypothetical protein